MCVYVYPDQASARQTLKAQQDAQASLEAEKLRLAEELQQRLQRLQESHRAEMETVRGEAQRSAKEAEDAARAALAAVAADRDAAVAAAGQNVSAATEDAERLRERLQSISGEVRADLENEFQERERILRDEVRSEVIDSPCMICWGGLCISTPAPPPLRPPPSPLPAGPTDRSHPTTVISLSS